MLVSQEYLWQHPIYCCFKNVFLSHHCFLMPEKGKVQLTQVAKSLTCMIIVPYLVR